MPDSLEQAVADSTIHVLETSAFMSVWQWSEEDGDLPPPNISATMTFEGARTGRITLRVASDILPALSRNMMGDFDEGEVAAETAQDALRETLNMICGNMLTAWYGSEPVFHLHPPEIVLPPAEGQPDVESNPDVSMKFCLDNTLCIVEAAIESEVETAAAGADGPAHSREE
ncbi:chemotaxis protein CheX [bacterium]|nr:chemotaxis protein CheX [bacterium]MBU1984358.1 chemotaxis protein CheX [bacterium]